MGRKALQTAAAAVAITGLLDPATAVASMPVVDIAAVAQLRAQLEAWRNQLAGMSLQLAQLRDAYAAVTGHRGLQAVLAISPAARNYLPPTWANLAADSAGASGRYAALAAEIRAQMAANAVLTAEDLSRYPRGLRALLGNARETAAGIDVSMRVVYSQSSARFAQLQQLIDHIAITADAKGIAELQGRIAAEQAMLANEAIKLTAAGQVAASEAASLELQRREQVVANHGAFDHRLQPVPPVP
jgi:type IV secretion system protein VirB5